MTTTAIEPHPMKLDAELSRQLVEYAREQGRPANDIATEVLQEYLDDQSALARSAKARADYAAGRVIPHERVSEWLNSLGSDNPLEPPTCE